MRRKVLIVVMLIIAMLLQCVIPFVKVEAATSVSITLNSNLYSAVKKDLQRQGISAEYRDASSTIVMSNTNLEKVGSLYLSNSDISDLTGLDAFKNLSKINLHANLLTTNSNLQVLDKLTKLNDLDLSSNGIESIKSITRFSQIKKTDITNQEIDGSQLINVKVGEDTETYPTQMEVQLPDILLEDCNQIKPSWVTTSTEGDEEAPSIDYSKSFQPGSTTLVLNIAKGSGNSYQPLKGILKVEIAVVDSTTSKIKNTRITYLYAVVGSNQRGIVFYDPNLYYAVKEQLTRSQTVNTELQATNDRNLYEQAFDDMLTLVINDEDLTNRIPSLILHDKQIRDLKGIEEFVGLETELNLSYNYISSFVRLKELAENKNSRNSKVSEKYEEILVNLRKAIASYDEQIEIVKQAQQDYKDAENIAKGSGDNSEILTKMLELKKKEAEAQKNADTQLELILTYVDNLHKIYEKEYQLISLLPVSVLELNYGDMMNLELESIQPLAEAVMERVSLIEKGEGLTNYEKWAISKLLGEFGQEKGLSFETNKKDFQINPDDKTVEEVEIPIEFPISEFFEKAKASNSLTLRDYQQLIYIFKAVDSLSQIENYTMVKRIFGEEGDKSKDFSEEAYNTVKDTLKFNGFDTYFFEGERIKKTTNLTEACKPSECKETNGYEINLDKDDLFNIQISINEKEYSGSLETEDNIYKLLLAHREAQITVEDLEKYISMPKLEKLNLGDNTIKSLDGLSLHNGLVELNLYKNSLNNITDVDWTVFKNMEKLNLEYNQLSDISPLESLTSLQELNVSNNLISGPFTFKLLNMKDLKKADFSHNRINDIDYLNDQFILIAKGYDNNHDGKPDNLSVPDYLRAVNVDVSFKYQALDMDVVIVRTGDNFVELDLPLIFSQLEEMDYLNTSFGVYSISGLVSSDGRTVRLEVPAVDGYYVGKVTVEGKNGYGNNSSKGIGYGTYCEIGYDVITGSVPNQTPSDPEISEQPDESASINYGYKIDDGYVMIYKPETSLDEFTTNFVDNNDYKVSITENKSNSKIGTGAVVTVTDLSGEKVYGIFETVVKGDINGDGDVDALDSGIVRQVINDTTSLVGVYSSAADVNEDEDIDSLDSLFILQFRADRITSFTK